MKVTITKLKLDNDTEIINVTYVDEYGYKKMIKVNLEFALNVGFIDLSKIIEDINN